MSANSTDSDDGSSIGGTIKSGSVTSETWDFEAESFYLVGAGIMSSKK